MKPGFGVYVKEPSSCSVSVPLLGLVTSSANIVLPSGSLSLLNTPGAGTVNGVSSSVV